MSFKFKIFRHLFKTPMFFEIFDLTYNNNNKIEFYTAQQLYDKKNKIGLKH